MNIKYKLSLNSELKRNKLSKSNDLIKRDDYISFIKNNLDLIQCDKNELIKAYDLKHTTYVSQKFKFQFYYYNSIANNNKEQQAFENLLLYFTNESTTKKIIKKLNHGIISDNEIINDIRNNKAEKTKCTCNKWEYVFQNLANITLDLFNIKHISKVNLKYLDIGCGNSEKTLLFGKNLKLGHYNIYGTDIPKWGPYEQKEHKVQFKYIKNNKLDYPNNTFDIITAIFTLHHVESLDNFLKEIWRILKPNCYLIIIEHDAYDDFDKIIFGLEHKIYSLLYDNKSIIDSIDYMNTLNRFEWNYLLHKNKFKYIYDNILFMKTDRDIRYDKPFYAFYKKII
jgi:ubiquinone/menaquinone biosynthesis C-methylase UbiE